MMGGRVLILGAKSRLVKVTSFTMPTYEGTGQLSAAGGAMNCMAGVSVCAAFKHRASSRRGVLNRPFAWTGEKVDDGWQVVDLGSQGRGGRGDIVHTANLSR